MRPLLQALYDVRRASLQQLVMILAGGLLPYLALRLRVVFLGLKYYLLGKLLMMFYIQPLSGDSKLLYG